MSHPPSAARTARRRLLHWIGGLPLLALAAGLVATRPGRASRLRPTPADDLGPFYPLDWSGDIDADLTHVAGTTGTPEGKGLRVSGSVRDTDGRPVAEAVVEIWQADARGRYRHPGVDPRTRDAAFQGFGRGLTDAQGRYDFLTVMPGRYGTRPPHIHFRIAQPGRAEFVTQMYFRGDNREGNGFAPRERDALTVDLAPAGPALSARFDIVLADR